MNKKTWFNWGIWMGVVMGVYAFLYTLTPLSSYGVMWATFIAMPIFLTAGGKKEDLWTYICGGIVGVAWGYVFIQAGVLCVNAGMSASVANFLSTLVVTIVCVWVHGILLANTFLNTLPPIFGGMAATIAGSIFSDGQAYLLPLAATLVLGVLAGFACMYGLTLMNEDGSWKFLNKGDIMEKTSEETES